MRKCINQVFRPEKNATVQGMGNCVTCMPDKDNYKCAGYQPVNITIYQVRVVKP